MRNLTLTFVGLLLLIPTDRAVAESWLFVSLLTDKKIVHFQRDPDSGKLTRRGATDCPAEPACLSVSPDRRTLFASLRSSGQLASFRIDPRSGALTLISTVEGGADPAYLQPDRSGKFLLSAYYVANQVAVHRIAENGSLSRNPIQTLATAENAHGVALDATNKMAFVPHTGANCIYQFRFDERSGRLTPSQPPRLKAPAGHHPRHLAIAPSNRWAYSSNEAGDSISAFAIDSSTATLRLVQTLPTIPNDFDADGNSTARCEMTPDGRFVYVANRGHDSIAAFAVNSRNGRLTSLGQTPTEKTPRSFTIDPGGRFLYAAGQGSGKIAAFRIARDGTLKRFATYDAGPVAWWALAVDTPD